MKKVLVIQHVPHEGLGTIGPVLTGAGLDPKFLHVHKNEPFPRDLSGFGGLIVMGGPMGVYEDALYPFIKKEIRLIESGLKQRVPILGVCLGSQMIAAAAGSKVYKGKAKEIGWYDVELTKAGKEDRLFMGLPERFKVFQWHGDTFDVPKGAACLASSELFPHQVIRVGSAWGIQFHLEVTDAMIRDWTRINSAELASLKGAIDPGAIISGISPNIARMHAIGHTVLSRFARLIDK